MVDHADTLRWAVRHTAKGKGGRALNGDTTGDRDWSARTVATRANQQAATNSRRVVATIEHHPRDSKL